MAKKRTMKTWRGSTVALTRTSQRIADRVVRDRMTQVRQQAESLIRDRLRLQRTARNPGAITIPRTDIVTSKADIARAMARQRQLTTRLTKKAVAPRVTPELPGLVSFSVKFAPPYDYGAAEHDLQSPGNSAVADRFGGTMSGSVSNPGRDNFIHFVLVALGGFFFPPGNATAFRAHTLVSHRFAWWLNSFGAGAFTRGIIALQVIGYKKYEGGVSGDEIVLFDQSTMVALQMVQFDWGVGTDVPLSVAGRMIPGLYDFYQVSVMALIDTGTAPAGQGMPPSLAGGSVSVAVPSITLDVHVSPVASGG